MDRTDKRVIIYCRESRDDYGTFHERIEVQRDILLTFCERQGFHNVVKVVMDNNVSGTDFERLKPIVNAIHSNEVDVLVMKDASRLGRNQLECLNFMKLISENDIEIIFESESYNEDFFPLIAWFNEMRAKEDSLKIRRVLKHKMEIGQLLIRPTYGYQKKENALLPDPNTAPVVKEIFHMFLSGYRVSEIANILNYRGEPTPSRSQAQYYKSISYYWNRQHIYRILDNEIYAGTMIYGKRSIKSYKDKKVIHNRLENVITIAQHHEAIISDELFESVRQLRTGMKNRKTSAELPMSFSNLVFCGGCGAKLVQKKRHKRRDSYICSTYHREGKKSNYPATGPGCISHHLRQDELHIAITTFLAEELLSTQGYRNLLKKMFKSQSRGTYATPHEEKIIQEKKDCLRMLELLYTDRLNNVISVELFLRKQQEINEKINQLDAMYESAQQLHLARKQLTDQAETLFLRECIQLDNRLSRLLINKISYYLPAEADVNTLMCDGIPAKYIDQIQKQGGLVVYLN